jgi:hypothetical protein
VNARAYHEPVEIHIGDQTRHLMLTPKMWRLAQRALKGVDPRFALAEGGLDPVCIVAAFALMHEGKCSDQVVEAWITHAPEKTPELIDAVTECATRFLVTAGIIEAPPGPKADGATTPPL